MWFKRNHWMVVVVLMMATALLLAACGAPEEAPKEEPAIVEPIEGTDRNRVTLTERANERLDVQTEPVREEQVERKRTLGAEVEVVPVTRDEEIPHRLEFTVTDLTKDIAGVRTVVAWIVDISDGQVVEKEIAFYAQDNDGNVWFLGEHPEEYEDGEFVEAPTWVAGVENAIPGIKMKAEPRQGAPAYFQGWIHRHVEEPALLPVVVDRHDWSGDGERGLGEGLLDNGRSAKSRLQREQRKRQPERNHAAHQTGLPPPCTNCHSNALRQSRSPVREIKTDVSPNKRGWHRRGCVRSPSTV